MKRIHDTCTNYELCILSLRQTGKCNDGLSVVGGLCMGRGKVDLDAKCVDFTV